MKMQSGFPDYLNSTAPLNFKQINQNEESFYYGLFNTGAAAGFSEVVNSTQNLRRISSKESWKNATGGSAGADFFVPAHNHRENPQHRLQNPHSLNMSSLYYSGSMGNGGKSKKALSSSAEKGKQSGNLAKVNSKLANQTQDCISPLKDHQIKQTLIKSILMQDSLNQQKNKKYFLNLTLQQLIQQQKTEASQNQISDPQAQFVDPKPQAAGGSFKNQKRLNKTLDNRKPENLNATSQQRFQEEQEYQELMNIQGGDKNQSDLRQFINNFIQNQSNGDNSQDIYSSMGERRSRQQTKSFSSSVNKFSNTVKISDFNNTQQIFEKASKEFSHPKPKSKTSLKSTQNFNLQDEAIVQKSSMPKNNNAPQKYSALSTYSNQPVVELGSSHLQQMTYASQQAQQKSRKIVKPVHAQNQNNSNSQQRLNSGPSKHKKQASQEQVQLSQMLNLYTQEHVNPLAFEKLQDGIISQAAPNQNKTQQQLQSTAFNAYQVQSKYKTNQTLNNYLNNSSNTQKLKQQTQGNIKNRAKQTLSKSFLNHVQLQDLINVNTSQVPPSFNPLEAGDFLSRTFHENRLDKDQNDPLAQIVLTSQKLKKYQNATQHQRKLPKELTKSDIGQDLTQFGFQPKATSSNQIQGQPVSLVKKYQQKAAHLNNLQQQVNQAIDYSQAFSSGGTYQSNPYNFQAQLIGAKQTVKASLATKKQSFAQLKLQKEQVKEIQNRTQPIPRHVLEMAAAATGPEGSECSGSNTTALRGAAQGRQGGLNFSTGNSIILNRQQQSKESSKSRKSKASGGGIKKKGAKVEEQKFQQQCISPLEMIQKQQAEGADACAPQQPELQQKRQQPKAQRDDPAQIYNNKNTVILEEINSRFQDSLESQSQRTQYPPAPQTLEDSEYQDSLSKLDRFVLGKQVGQGAYAVVKVATLKKDGEKYAIKIYDKSKLTDTNRQRSVRREIKLLQKMNHENVVKIFEAFETEDFVYLVMEFVAGDNLYGYLKQQRHSRLEEQEAKRIFKQLLTALAYCHRKSIAHRDIKLENILLDERRNVKLIDFGFSTCIPNDKKIKMFCGTPSYMAPEIVNKEEYAGPPADIWASGVLLYALVNGKFPFRGDTDRELYRRINRGTFEVHNPNVSPFLIHFLSRMINVDADERPSAEELLGDRWFSVELSQNCNEEESATLTEERERLKQEYIADQKKQLKAQILAKGFEKQKTTISLVSNGQKTGQMVHNINLGGNSHGSNLIQVNPQNLMPGLRQGLINSSAYHPGSLLISQANPQSDYGTTQQTNIRRLNQEAYSAYYNTSGNPASSWGASHPNLQNPYYNNFFTQQNTQGQAQTPHQPGLNLNFLQGFGQNQNAASGGSPSKVQINTGSLPGYPLAFSQHAPNQVGTPQVFASPTGFTCQANTINNNFNIVNNITQVTCLPQQSDLEQNATRQPRSETVIQVRSEEWKEPEAALKLEGEGLEEEIIETLARQGGYQRSHVVSQIDQESSQIAALYHKMKEDMMSHTQNRPLSLQPYGRRGKCGLQEQNLMVHSEGQELSSGMESTGYLPYQAYSYLNQSSKQKQSFKGPNYARINHYPHYENQEYSSYLNYENQEVQEAQVFSEGRVRAEGKILFQDQREQESDRGDEVTFSARKQSSEGFGEQLNATT